MAKKRAKSKATKAKDIQATPQNESIADKSIAAVLNTKKIPPPVLMKVCRLCETKDGPFLNIFDADKVTAKKIDDIMPFRIEENDDLPHKICFRCSAKLEELYEFLQKCIKTQENLRTAMGKTGPLVMKSKTRALWEENLEKKNLSNEDICDILIKKAMEGIKDMAPSVLSPPEEEKPLTPVPVPAKKSKPHAKKTATPVSSDDEQDEPSLKQVKLLIEKCDEKPLPKTTRSSKTETLLDSKVSVSPKMVLVPKKPETIEPDHKKDESPKNLITNFSMDFEENIVPEEKTPEKNKPKDVKKKSGPKTKPFNIMDHVCTIKVNGVGILFQCKLCNRNFLKKDVVESHGCAKNNVPKDISQINAPLPEPPKLPNTVKYITIDKDFKKNLVNEFNKRPVEQIVPEKVLPDPQPVQLVSVKSEPVDRSPAVPPPAVPPPVKPRPKAGPASRMKQLEQRPPSREPQRIEPTPIATNTQENSAIPVSITMPTVNFPIGPSIHSRYKLVPGPNNTFTLVEDASQSVQQNISVSKQTEKNRKTLHVVQGGDSSSEIIDLEENDEPVPEPPKGPYPVGLFQTVPHSSGIYPTQLTQASFGQPQFNSAQFAQPQFNSIQFSQPHFNQTQLTPTPQYIRPQYTVASFIPQTIATPPPIAPKPSTFTTPAMKKQSYTIVQTGNPSKLLISTKPQPQPAPPAPVPTEEPSKRKLKKKPETQDQSEFNKNRQLFTFVNVDSESASSYVLPTNNIIQESQITTSTPVAKVADNKEYTCNMCNEKFSREKKLLTHIQSHYSTMDAEDEKRAAPRKKSRKS